MKRNPVTLTVGFLLILIFVLVLFSFQVRTTEVAVVTTFGKPTRPISEPGFKLKWPIQRVHKFDKRTQTFERTFEQVLTADDYNLIILVYVGWNISEPKAFFPRFGGSIQKAEDSLEGLLRNTYSGVVGQHPFSHFISTDEKELRFVQIEKEMLEKIQADARANNYGIEIKFLGIKKLGLPETVTEKVFERMRSERQVLVDKITSEGQSQAAIIRSTADRDSAKTLADADAEATRIKAQGEKEAAKSFQVFAQDPELANFILKLDGLEAFLKDRTTLILDQGTPPIDLLRIQPPNAPTNQAPNSQTH